MSRSLLIILGNQLFPVSLIKQLRNDFLFMAEDVELCTHFRYHKHKLILFLASMRRYRDLLIKHQLPVTYCALDGEDGDQSFCGRLTKFIDGHQITQVTIFEIEDKFFEQRLFGLFENMGLAVTVIESPMFLCPRANFKQYLSTTTKPFMKTFYENERRRLNILMDGNDPVGGQFSFDQEYRKTLPANVHVPEVPKYLPGSEVREVMELVNKRFSNHPGTTSDFWLATTHDEARRLLDDFVANRLKNFGYYQDAFTDRSDFVFHSVLSPYINMGMLLPQEVMESVLAAFDRKSVSMNSVEGFIRQVMGWREFMRGVYRAYSQEQEKLNFFNHNRKLKSCWYDASTGIEPLDQVLRKVRRFGYAHHIERLMILSNVMLLLKVSPKEAYRWFMEMFIDSSDWVMAPNVFGMGQFSDGGLFATKPYICGSNYWRKMGKFPQGPWCDVLDALYWQFIADNRTFFSTQYRMRMMVSAYDKKTSEDKRTFAQVARQC